MDWDGASLRWIEIPRMDGGVYNSEERGVGNDGRRSSASRPRRDGLVLNMVPRATAAAGMQAYRRSELAKKQTVRPAWPVLRHTRTYGSIKWRVAVGLGGRSRSRIPSPPGGDEYV